VVIEHRLARLGQLGIGQARYAGRRKSKFQLTIAAAIANLRCTWNWAATQDATNPFDADTSLARAACSVPRNLRPAGGLSAAAAARGLSTRRAPKRPLRSRF